MENAVYSIDDKVIARALVGSPDMTGVAAADFAAKDGINWADAVLLQADTTDWYVVARNSDAGSYEVARFHNEDDARAAYNAQCDILTEAAWGETLASKWLQEQAVYNLEGSLSYKDNTTFTYTTDRRAYGIVGEREGDETWGYTGNWIFYAPGDWGIDITESKAGSPVALAAALDAKEAQEQS